MATWVNLMDIIYPVGSVYSSYTSTSPASRFGGSWTAITGAFPYYNAGTGTGGSNSHTLTIAEMPNHGHPLLMDGQAGSMDTGIDWTWNKTAAWQTGGSVPNSNIRMGGTGGGQAHNNMPAYQTLYAWRRTA